MEHGACGVRRNSAPCAGYRPSVHDVNQSSASRAAQPTYGRLGPSEAASGTNAHQCCLTFYVKASPFGVVDFAPMCANQLLRIHAQISASPE